MSEKRIEEFCNTFMKEHEWLDNVSDGNNCETCGNHSNKFKPIEIERIGGMNVVRCNFASKLAKNPIFAKKDGRCNLHTAIM